MNERGSAFPGCASFALEPGGTRWRVVFPGNGSHAGSPRAGAGTPETLGVREGGGSGSAARPHHPPWGPSQLGGSGCPGSGGTRAGSWLCPSLRGRGAAGGPGSRPVGPAWALINSRNCSRSKINSLPRSFFFSPRTLSLPTGHFPAASFSHPIPSRSLPVGHLGVAFPCAPTPLISDGGD